ncbi:hypothetical protein SCHPADRAFT_344691 [Schizopora paradoxa]|uniref:MYND-type domain-containing protein n=1 Tax=Schizopora paradoxa TaxID=27342 RepID=A0A0H2RQ39_9AGAM|nr:hypothetical protein SCHPADRAFT_344691 [Schizopora paradoxa]
MQFLFNIYSPSKSDPNLQALVEGKDPISVLLLGVFNAFLGVQKAYSANLVTETPGAVRLATQLWIREGLDGSKLMQPKSLTKVALLVFQVVLGDKPTSKALDEVIEGADAEGEPVSKRLPSLLQSYMRFTLDFGGDLANVTEVIEALVRMTSSNHSHPVSQAFVSQGMVPFVVKLITSLDATLPHERSLENAPLLNPMFFHGFQYICNSFYASASVQHVVQAIDAGFLEVFVAWGIALPSLTAKEHDHVLHLFSDSLIPLLVYLPVLSASERALKRIDEQSTTQEPFHKSTEKAKDMWLKFVWTVEKRFKLSLASMTINDVVNPRSKRTFMCDNCCKSYPYSTLKACAACGLVSYCSKACQTQHWKEKGHRERCKSLRGDANVVSYKNLLNKSGKSASPRQVVTFICDLARSEALEHMDALVALAKEQLPDVAMEDVGVEVNYGEFPSTFKVFARNECIQARQALSKGVTEEINNDFPPESREFVGEMLRRSKKDQVQFNIVIRRGPGRRMYQCSIGVAKFWDRQYMERRKLDLNGQPGEELQKLESLLSSL